MGEPKKGCYCGAIGVDIEIPTLTCLKCKEQFHPDCLKSGNPSILVGDVFFDFTCDRCSDDGIEIIVRMKMQWMQVIVLALYNLQLVGKAGKFGYYRWKEHICAYIDQHWNLLFDNYRKKTNLWHGTVAGVLSSGCPSTFVSGAKELGESGWWRLAEMKPPHLKQLQPVSNKGSKRRTTLTLTSSVDSFPANKMDSLRCRRGKTSIEAAMELKAKRERMFEAKEIKRSKMASASAETKIESQEGGHRLMYQSLHIGQQTTIKQEPVDTSYSPLMSLSEAGPIAVIKQEPVDKSYGQSNTVRSSFQMSPNVVPAQGSSSASSSQLAKFLLADMSTLSSGSSTSISSSLKDLSVLPSSKKGSESVPSSATSSHSKSMMKSASTSKLPTGQSMTQTVFVPGSFSRHSSVSELNSSASVESLTRSGSYLGDTDEDSQFSHLSGKADMYLTENDLKAEDMMPSMLMCDDPQDENSDSDLEIDPGTITPPPSSPGMEMQSDSPSVMDMLSSMDQDHGLPKDLQLGIKREIRSPVAMDSSETSFSTDDFLRKMEKEETEDPPSVVDSESEQESESSFEDESTAESSGGLAEKREQKMARKAKEMAQEEEQRESNLCMMSLYEERLLLKKLNAADEKGCLTPEYCRLRRKLIVRQLKRDHGLPLFDLDADMNKLAHKSWGENWQQEGDCRVYNPQGLPTSRMLPGDVRILDRFQVNLCTSRMQMQQQPSFLNRLVGTEDDQLQPITSPYTARVLKPFIRRDFETRPLKMRLLQEIQSYPHRNEPSWKPPDPPPIDYCYVRPQHIPSVNSLCREFFWPGIDLSECLQYPDFSCVVLYRKFVIGFAFMVPDVNYKEAYISFIFTHPEWRRAGIARFMLYHLIQTCMGKDVNLHVSATNSAMLLYQQFGFKPEEFILDFYDKYYPENFQECKHAFYLRLQR